MHPVSNNANRFSETADFPGMCRFWEMQSTQSQEAMMQEFMQMICLSTRGSFWGYITQLDCNTSSVSELNVMMWWCDDVIPFWGADGQNAAHHRRESDQIGGFHRQVSPSYFISEWGMGILMQSAEISGPICWFWSRWKWRERERERNETKFPWHWIVRVKRWWRCLSVGSKMIFVGCRRRPSSGVSSPGEETFSNRRLGADGCSRFKRHYHKIWFSLSIFSNDFPITRGCIN